MSLIIKDRVKDTTTTTGTGSVTVSGTAPTGFRTFNDAMASSDTSVITIHHQTADEWEICETTYNGSNVLTRGTLLDSSTGSRVSFSAGTKDVWIDLAAAKVVDLSRPQTLTNKTIDGASNTLKNIWGAVNLKDWGAKGDGITKTDGAITAADNTLTSASSSFTAADVGKAIFVYGAGTSSGLLATTIASVNSATSVELTDAASTTVTSSGKFTYGTDDTDALNAAIEAVSRGKAVLPPGIYVVTDTVIFDSKNVTNNATKFNLDVYAYGARIETSVDSDGVALRIDDCKNLLLRGPQLKSENKAAISLDGAWTSCLRDIRAGNLPLTLGMENLDDTSDNNLWLNFDNCEFNAVKFYTGDAADPTFANAVYFDRCRIGGVSLDGDTGPEYDIYVYGSQGPFGVHFTNCDISYYTIGMLYVDEAVADGSQINIHGGYCDTGLIGTPVDTKGLIVNFYDGMVVHSSPQYLDTAIADVGSQQVLDFSRGTRNGSRQPLSGVNLIKNGDFQYGLQDVTFNSSASFTRSVESGAGIYGKYAKFSATEDKRVNFNSVELPFDGVYAIAMLIRNRGDDLVVDAYDGDGTALTLNAIEVPGNMSDWVIASCTLPALDAGSLVQLRTKIADPFNVDYDVGYVGLTYGRVSPILAPQPRPREFIVLEHNAVASSLTGTTTETELASIKIPGGVIGPNGIVRITALWSYSNNSNSKTMRIKHSTSSGSGGASWYTSFGATTTASARTQSEFHNRDSESSQIGGLPSGSGGWNTSGSSLVSGTLDTSVDTWLNFTGTLGNSADTITLEAYTVEVLYGA